MIFRGLLFLMNVTARAFLLSKPHACQPCAPTKRISDPAMQVFLYPPVLLWQQSVAAAKRERSEGSSMKLPHRLLWSVNRLLSVALFVTAFQVLDPAPGRAQQAGWTGSAGMGSGCVGWNCDGKNPCTGMGCDGNSSTKNTKAGSTKTTGSANTKSSPSKGAKASTGASKGSSAKTKNSLPDVEALTGKSQKSDGWGGERNTDSRTDDQRYQPEAKKAIDELQRAIGGGKPPPEGWGGGLKSDSRTIEQKLDTP